MCLLGIVGRPVVSWVSWGVLGCPGVIRLTASKEIPLFTEDITERTCSHSSLGCLGIHSRICRGTESIRTQVNSYLGQFVLILVNSYSVFGQFVLILSNLVNSYSFWSISTHTKNMILIIYIILLKIDR